MWLVQGQVMLKKPDMFGRKTYMINYGAVSSKSLARKVVNHMNTLYYKTDKLPIHFCYEMNYHYSKIDKLIHHMKYGSKWMLEYDKPAESSEMYNPKSWMYNNSFWTC